MPKLVELTDEQYAAQKRAVANRAEQFEVTGTVGIRDCVTRDIVEPGGYVRLDPQVKSNILLVRSGAVRKVEAKTADKPAKADQKG